MNAAPGTECGIGTEFPLPPSQRESNQVCKGTTQHPTTTIHTLYVFIDCVGWCCRALPYFLFVKIESIKFESTYPSHSFSL